MIIISGSVGEGGTNNSSDVLIIQQSLNKVIEKQEDKLEEDGLYGQNTRNFYVVCQSRMTAATNVGRYTSIVLGNVGWTGRRTGPIAWRHLCS